MRDLIRKLKKATSNEKKGTAKSFGRASSKCKAKQMKRGGSRSRLLDEIASCGAACQKMMMIDVACFFLEFLHNSSTCYTGDMNHEAVRLRRSLEDDKLEGRRSSLTGRDSLMEDIRSIRMGRKEKKHASRREGGTLRNQRDRHVQRWQTNETKGVGLFQDTDVGEEARWVR